MNKLVYFLIIPLIISGVEIVINQPGETILGESIIFNPITSNDTIIQIDSDNVILDLGGLIIEQGNSVGSIQGIEITSGRSNITIKNGTISLVTGTGIVVPDDCFNVTISDIKFVGCQTRALQISGGGTTRDCSISNCSILDSCTGTSGDVAMALTDVEMIRISQCSINNSGNISNDFIAIALNGCQICDFEDISITANQGSSIIGIDVQDSAQCMFKQCVIRDNSPTGGIFRGFDFHGTSNQFHIVNDLIINNNSSTTDCRGIYLEANSQNNLFQNCSIIGNTGGAVYGFYLTGGIANNFENAIIDCFVMSNSTVGVGNFAIGFWVDNSNFGSIQRTIIADNTSANSIAAGIVIITVNNWDVADNIIYRNIGSSSGNSIGVFASGASTTLFTQNIGFNNGTGSATANQFPGIPASSILARTTSNMNSVCVLSNVGIPN